MISAFATVVVFLAITLIFPAIKWTNDPDVLAMEELRYKCRDCEKAKQLAYQDFNRNKLRIIFWGLPDEGMTTKDMILRRPASNTAHADHRAAPRHC